MLQMWKILGPADVLIITNKGIPGGGGALLAKIQGHNRDRF